MKQEIDQLLASHAPTFFAANELIYPQLKKLISEFRSEHGKDSVLQDHVPYYSYLLHLESVFVVLNGNEYLKMLKELTDKNLIEKAKIDLSKKISTAKAIENKMDVFKKHAGELWGVLQAKRDMDPYYVYENEKDVIELIEASVQQTTDRIPKGHKAYLALSDAAIVLGDSFSFKQLDYFEYKYRHSNMVSKKNKLLLDKILAWT